MKLRETLTKQQTIDLLSGNVVGIFPSMILSEDAFYGKLYELCLGYYTARSGEKTISMTYERFISLIKENPEISKSPEELIGALIRGKFLDKWNRVYDVLITSQYDALNNRESTEDKTGNNQNKDTHNTTKAKEGNNTDVMTYDTENGRKGTNTDVMTYDTESGKQGTNTDTTTFDTNVEDNGKTGTSETTTRNVTDENNVYGFNSPSAVGDTNSTETTSETIVGEADKNTSHNLQTKTGTESKEFGIDEIITKTGTESKEIGIDETVTKTGTDSRAIGISESETHTGTDTTDITISEKLVKSGRDGSGAELITEELNLRNTQLFFDIIYADIDSIATLQIYI